MFRLSPDGRRPIAVSLALNNHGRLRSAVVGPDGALYVTTSNGASTDEILRVEPHAVS
jgi:glucose/arabinose dehydrogenase